MSKAVSTEFGKLLIRFKKNTHTFAFRPPWPGNQPGLQRQLIHLDAQTHAHLKTLDPLQRAEYLAKLHKRNLLLRQQGLFLAFYIPVISILNFCEFEIITR